jgi:hypothetical protein
MTMGLNSLKFSKNKNNYTVKLLRMKFLNDNKVLAVGDTFRDYYK